MTTSQFTVLTEQLTQFFQTSKLQNKVQKVSVFGSTVRNTQTSKSDIDFVIYFDPQAHITLFDMSRLKNELSLFLHTPVDLITENGIKPHLKNTILNSLVDVYQK